MGKSLYIAEKPSVAQEFAKALHQNFQRRDGYLEAEDSVVTWCVGHLVTMSYPEKYDEKYRRWSFETLPFLPEEFQYEVISGVSKQFGIVKGLLTRPDIDTIYVCTDSGREGEYIYRLVAQMAGVRGTEQVPLPGKVRVLFDRWESLLQPLSPLWIQASILLPGLACRAWLRKDPSLYLELADCIETIKEQTYISLTGDSQPDSGFCREIREKIIRIRNASQ